MKTEQELPLSELPISSSLFRKNYLILFCYFCTGFCSLVFEICWIRTSSIIFGSTLYATSTVFAVYFCGIAFGNAIAAKKIPMVSNSLFFYGIIEILIGVYGIFTPHFFSMIDTVYSHLYPSIQYSFPMIVIIRFLCISCIVAFPSFLMGTTFPLVSCTFIIEKKDIDIFIPFLYSLNTFGAVAGTVCCGFVFIRYLGLRTSFLIGSTIAILIGAIILYCSLPLLRPLMTLRTLVKKGSYSGKLRRKETIVFPVLFFFSGFLGLSYELVWSRYIILLLHNTIVTSSLILAVYLTGIALGGLSAIKLLKLKINASVLFGISQLISSVLILCIIFIPFKVWESILDSQNAITRFWILAAVFLVPAIGNGIAFPSLLAAAVTNVQKAPQQIGIMSGFNTCGCICGSLVTAFFSISYFGIEKTVLYTTLATFLIGTYSINFLDIPNNRLKSIAASIFMFIVWLCIPTLLKTKIPHDFLGNKENIVDIKEGLTSNFAVVKTESDATVLEIDRLWQGQKEPTHQIMASHIPMILNPHVQDVLVLGMGVGQIAEHFLYYPIKKLVCVDIEKELPDLIRKHFNSAWLSDDRVSIVIDDGKNYIKHSRNQFDCISIEIGQTFRPGLAGFYTKDFYEDTKHRLNEYGMICQFLPIIFSDVQSYKSLIKTFISVYPNSMLWYNNYEFIIIGIKSSLPQLDSLQFMRRSVILKKLSYTYWGGAQYSLDKFENFISGYLLGPNELKTVSIPGIIYSDDRPHFEFIAAHHQEMSIVSMRDILDSISAHLIHPDCFLAKNSSKEKRNYILTLRNLNLQNIVASQLYEQYFKKGRNTISLLLDAERMNPKNLAILYEIAYYYTRTKEYGQVLAYSEKIISENPSEIEIVKQLISIYIETGHIDQAIKQCQSLLLGSPTAEIHLQLGKLFQMKGDAGLAVQHYLKTLTLDPVNVEAREFLNRNKQ